MIVTLLAALALGGAAHAGPMLVSGDYSLALQGSGQVAFTTAVQGPVAGSFSDSVDEAATQPPVSATAAASLDLSISQERIVVASAVSTGLSTTPQGFFPTSSQAQANLQMSFGLAHPALVVLESRPVSPLDGKFGRIGFFAVGPTSSITEIVCPLGLDTTLAFGGQCTLQLDPGFYAVSSTALVSACILASCGLVGSSNSADIGLEMSFAPIPETSAAVAFPLGVAVVALAVAGIRRSRAGPHPLADAPVATSQSARITS